MPRLKPKYLDQTFGLLTLTAHRGRFEYDYECACGNTGVVNVDNLIRQVKNGRTPSCGCNHQRGENNRSHGLSSHPLYPVWRTMTRQGQAKIAPEWWGDPTQFIADMYPTYSSALWGQDRARLRLRRKDKKRPYSKGNCEWASRHTPDLSAARAEAQARVKALLKARVSN